MSRIFGFFTHPLLVAIVGFIAAALVIWYVGPLIAIGSMRPFEAEWVRWTLIALVGLFIIGRQVWRWLRAKMASRKLMEGLTKSPANRPVGPSESQQEVQLLSQRFEEAIATLRKVRLQGRTGRMSSIFARSSTTRSCSTR